MWTVKTFKTREAVQAFISKHGRKLQWQEVFVENGYAIECRRLEKPTCFPL